MSTSIGHVRETLTGSANGSEDSAEKLYSMLKEWGFKEGLIEEGRVGIDVSARIDKHGEDYAEHLEESFGTKHPFIAASLAGKEYEPGSMGDKSIKHVDKMVEKNVVDASTVQEAVPIEVDPLVIDIQRSRAPVLDVIATQTQNGYTAQYNVISDRSEPIGYAEENEVIDLSDLDAGDFTMPSDDQDMSIYVDQINVSDFSQRATDSLDYMDLMNTTAGQRITAHALTKAAAYFYADSSAGEASAAGYDSLGSGAAYDGFKTIAENEGNSYDRTTVEVGDGQAGLEDLKKQLTTEVENTGLTYERARILVSPTFFDELENEGNPVTRLDTFAEGINFGARQMSIKGTPVTECPNISPAFELPESIAGTEGDEVGPGHAFIVDEMAMQWRALAPLFTLPLGRVGLADKAAMAEYGTLVDKSQGAHTTHFEYDVAA